MKNLKILHALDSSLLEQCLKIRNDVFTIEKGVPKSIEADEYDYIGGDCDHFLIKCDDENAGTIRCMHISDYEVKYRDFVFIKCREIMAWEKRQSST